MLEKFKDLDKNEHAKLLAWLNEASDVLMQAYSCRIIAKLPNYFSRDVCIKINRDMMTDNPRYVGSKSNRKDRWMLDEQATGELSVFKLVDYTGIKMGRRIITDCDTDTIDLWTIAIKGNSYVCTGIRRVDTGEFREDK